MSIKSAILGILSWKSSSGYELKKLFEESSFMYWSGNNNQIYKALLQMQAEGYVSCEVIHQEGAPSKKEYRITEAGLAQLKAWLLSPADAPEFKKPFLIQLAWSDLLTDQELNELLTKYEHELKVQLLSQEEQNKRSRNFPDRSPRETLIWDMIGQNLLASYETELHWVQTLRKSLCEIKSAGSTRT